MGSSRTPIRLVSHRVEDNEWRAVNQVTVRSKEVQRRFDVVLYLNGMPVVIVELKNAGSKHATIAKARPARDLPRRVPDGLPVLRVHDRQRRPHRRYGTSFTPLNHYSPWNVDDDGRPPAPTWPTTGSSSWAHRRARQPGAVPADPAQLRRVRRGFGHVLVKRIAKPHQYFAVTKAVATTVAAATNNARRASSGTPRARAGRWRWSSTPTSSRCTDRSPSSTRSSSRRSTVSRLLTETPIQVPSRDALRPRCATGSPAASTSRHCRSSDAPEPSATPGSTTRSFPTGATSS